MADAKLGAAIQETVDIHCESGGLVLEVLRGIRFHFEKMIKGLTGPMAAKAQLGLGHSYSRAKVKFNVHRVDNMIIQSISLLDQLDKDINTFSMRIRYNQDRDSLLLNNSVIEVCVKNCQRAFVCERLISATGDAFRTLLVQM